MYPHSRQTQRGFKLPLGDFYTLLAVVAAIGLVAPTTFVRRESKVRQEHSYATQMKGFASFARYAVPLFPFFGVWVHTVMILMAALSGGDEDISQHGFIHLILLASVGPAMLYSVFQSVKRQSEDMYRI